MQTPQTLGKYRVLSLLGGGGSGVVFRSEDPDTGAPLAIKTTLGSSRPERAALDREIAALSRLTRRRRHGIVQLLDAGVEAGKPWYAMPFVVGEDLNVYKRRIWGHSLPHGAPRATLATQLATARVSEMEAASTVSDLLDTPAARATGGNLAEVLELGLALAQCLHGIHDDGVVHGDLTPANVLRTPAGEPVLVDFGTAFQLHQGDFLREVAQITGQRVGTPGFMAPEQIRGEGVDPRSDLYALGCLLYELLTGNAPFRAGVPGALLRQHLSSTPRSLCELVPELTPELDRLVLSLLEKHPQRRPSRADDVANKLLALLGRQPVHAAANWTLALYRPLLVGRSALLSELTELLPRAGGGGCVVSLGGPSGSGKTRVLNELAASAVARGCEVAYFSCSGPLAQANEPVSGLIAFRALLAQLAMRVRDAAPHDSSLAEALAILAPYASEALSDVPLPPLRNVPSRSDVAASVERLLRACCRGCPLLLVLDDLQWADELTMLFVRERLAALADADLLVMCVYRSEEIGEKLAAIRACAQRDLQLSGLELHHVYAIARDMLATDVAPEGLPEFLLENSGGNPFLIAEYLRAAVSRGLVSRDRAGRFFFGAPIDRAVPMPESLQGLFSLRLVRLSEKARAALELGAVLGREFASAQFSALSSDLLGAEALEELVSEQILDCVGDGRYRFVHDKLREAQELALRPERRRELHHLAAEALESSSGQSDSAVERRAELGLHWHRAGIADKALACIKDAALAYQRLHAHGRAAALYRIAIAQCEALACDEVHRRSVAAELEECLGDALLAQASHADARAAFERALALANDTNALARARNLRKVASSFWRLHAHDDARRTLEQAALALARPVPGDPLEHFVEHIEIQLGRFEHLYFSQDRSGAAQSLLTALEAPIAEHATPAQRVRYYLCAASDTMARTRFAFSEEALRYARQGEGIAVELLTLHEEALAQFIVGFALMLGDRSNRRHALGYFERAARGASRAGDRTLASRVAIYRALTLVRLDDVDGARSAGQDALEQAEAAKIEIYAAAAHACAAWVEWRSQADDVAQIRNRAEEAQRIWRDKPASFPFRWCLSFVLLELAQRKQNMEAQAGAIQQLLDPLQQKLPDELEVTLRSALDACNERRLADAFRAVDEALRLGRFLGFC